MNYHDNAYSQWGHTLAGVLGTYAENLDRIPTPESVMDFGCGVGYLLEYWRRRGSAILAGVERDGGQRERVSEIVRSDDALLCRDLQSIERRGYDFDCVCAFNVIEHLPKPDVIPTLAKLWALVAPGGRLLIRVPNAASLFASKGRYVDLTHELSFTEESLKQALWEAGVPKHVHRVFAEATNHRGETYVTLEMAQSITLHPWRYPRTWRSAWKRWRADAIRYLQGRLYCWAEIQTHAPKILTETILAEVKK